MGTCVDCGGYSYTYYGCECLCVDCRKRRKQAEVIEKSKSINHCSDFRHWDSDDMSELFWIHLGRYVKEPNSESLHYMELAYRWACHDNHGLSNSFHNALAWAGLDLYDERCKLSRSKKR